MGLTYEISRKLDFGEKKLIKIYILLFFTNFKLLMSQTILWKFQKSFNKWNLFKICIQTTHLIEVCIFCSHFYYGKKN